MSERKQIVLPADVYDTLEFSALVYGGVGGNICFDREDAPVCIVGHAVSADGVASAECACGLLRAGLCATVNDEIVPEGKRLTWKQYTRRGNIVRGAA